MPGSAGAADRLRVAVLASGRGSNLRALFDAQAATQRFDIVLVAGDRPEAKALRTGAAAGSAIWARSPVTFVNRAAFDAALAEATEAANPDLIVCAGYMRLLGPAFLQSIGAPVINVHPSLLPRYPGLETHRRALAAGDREHGATVHFVDATLDGGAPIAQVRFPIPAGCGAAALVKLTLEHEHRLLPAVVTACANGDLDLAGPSWRGQPLCAPLRLSPVGLLETTDADTTG